MGVARKGTSEGMQNARQAPTTYGLVPPIISNRDRRGGARGNAKGAKEKGGEEENLKAMDARETPNLQATKAKSPASTSTTEMDIADLRKGVIIATKLKEGKGKRHLL
jgi:hypothetical protein